MVQSKNKNPLSFALYFFSSIRQIYINNWEEFVCPSSTDDQLVKCRAIKFGLFSFFNGISMFMGYFIPKLSL